MATTAQIEANRRNAQHSTGPRTKQGKARSCLNAYKNGSRSRTILPGLPHEDPDQIQERTVQYLEDLQPRDSTELDLVHQMARLSLAIERGDRMEIAHMAHRGDQVARQKLMDRNADQRKKVRELGCKLIYIVAAEDVKVMRTPPRGDDPAQLVEDLETTSEGCRWLLERWQEYRALLDSRVRWDEPVLLRFFRLQGKQIVEAAFNVDLNAIFLAWDVLIPDYAKKAWKFFQHDWPMSHPANHHWLTLREIGPRPANPNDAWALLGGIVDRHIERLKKLLAERLDLESVPDDGWADRAALDCSREFERHRRSQSARTRELLKLIEVFCKLRKAAPANATAEDKHEMAQVPSGQVAEQGQEAHAAQPTAEERPMMDGTCQMADGPWSMTEDEDLTAQEASELPAEDGSASQKAPSEANLATAQTPDQQNLCHRLKHMQGTIEASSPGRQRNMETRVMEVRRPRPDPIR